MKTEFPALEGIFGQAERDKRTPLPLKSHHISMMYALWILTRDVTDKKPSIVKELIKDRVRQEIEVIAEDELPQNIPGYDFPDYGKDQAGFTQADQEVFYKRYLDMNTLFITLPDNYPVLISELPLDIFCNICIVGNHCRRPYKEGMLSRNLRDAQILIGLLNDHPEFIVGKYETKSIQGTGEEKDVELRTTLGTLRNTFAYTRDIRKKGKDFDWTFD